MDKIISKTIKIKSDKMPPNVDFIENEIKKLGFEPIRWAIVEINDKELTINLSARKLAHQLLQ